LADVGRPRIRDGGIRVLGISSRPLGRRAPRDSRRISVEQVAGRVDRAGPEDRMWASPRPSGAGSRGRAGSNARGRRSVLAITANRLLRLAEELCDLLVAGRDADLGVDDETERGPASDDGLRAGLERRSKRGVIGASPCGDLSTPPGLSMRRKRPRPVPFDDELLAVRACGREVSSWDGPLAASQLSRLTKRRTCRTFGEADDRQVPDKRRQARLLVSPSERLLDAIPARPPSSAGIVGASLL